MQSLFGIPFLAVAMACMVACDQPIDLNVRCTRAAITGGTERTEYLALDPRQESAVCELQLLDAAGLAVGVCSASLIKPDTALTAAHCLADPSARVVIRCGDKSVELGESTLEAVVEHPTLDLALVKVRSRLLAGGAWPLPIAFDSKPVVGSLLQIAGFGFTEDGVIGVRHFAVTTVVEVGDEQFRVSADGRAGACDGDSGGPALVRDNAGRVAVVGVLSGGAASCAASDSYVRVDTMADWLAANGAPYAAPSALLADCGLVASRGRCFADIALWCEGEMLRSQRCAATAPCGFSSEEQGFRCVPLDQDPCEGIDDRGRCEGNDRLRCVEGEVVRDPCGVCGAECSISVRTGEAICNASD